MTLAHLSELGKLAERCAVELAEPVRRYTELVRATLAVGRTVFFAGNGGSAAHAQHIATEYVVRYLPVKRKAAAVLALSTDSSLVTAAANDLGFEQTFARQIEAHGRKGDVLVLVSTSGNSPNLLRAAAAARAAALTTVGLLARGGGPLKDAVDLVILVPADGRGARPGDPARHRPLCVLADRAGAVNLGFSGKRAWCPAAPAESGRPRPRCSGGRTPT